MASTLRASILAASTLACMLSSIALVSADDVWDAFETGSMASFRGLSTPSHQVAWACGSQGTIVRTTDGGNHWQRISILNLESVEIRSIHAWDMNRAIVATAGQPSLILKTVDAGASWSPTYENKSPQAFINGMRFWNHDAGLAFGDPVDGELLILKTVDGGNSWNAVAPSAIPKIDAGEAGFAASNSSLHTLGNQHAWIGLGGATEGASRVYRSSDQGDTWTTQQATPIKRGPSSGVFSVAFETERKGIAVGGDHTNVNLDTENIAVTDDGGLTWRAPRINRPRGFRSSVVKVCLTNEEPADAKFLWLTCGPGGCDWSSDREEWFAMSASGYHVISIGTDNSVWAAGSEGRIARLKNSWLNTVAIE